MVDCIHYKDGKCHYNQEEIVICPFKDIPTWAERQCGGYLSREERMGDGWSCEITNLECPYRRVTHEKTFCSHRDNHLKNCEEQSCPLRVR